MLERLRGRKLVVVDGTVVTCYRSSRRDRKRVFRRGLERRMTVAGTTIERAFNDEEETGGR